MGVSVDVNMTIRATNQPTVAGASSPAITYDAYLTRKSLSGSSTPAVSAVTGLLKTLSSGSATIDLTSVPDVVGTQSMSGLSLRTLYLSATAANSGSISIQTGATNGYPLFGSSGKVTLPPGDSIAMCLSDTNAVDGTHKTIDLAGSGTDSIQVQMTFG